MRKLLNEWHKIAALERWRSNNIAIMKVKVDGRMQVRVHVEVVHACMC